MVFKELYNRLLLPGREEEARVAILGLASGLNTLIIAPPGTAKTMIIDRLAELVDAKYFRYLLTKFTEPEELFGYPDIKELTNSGKIKYVTKNKLPEAEIAFIDEIFKASSAILNTLLTIVNEKKFYDGERFINVPLHVLYSASNEIPDDEELSAIYDRFTLRLFSDYVDEDRLVDVLIIGHAIYKGVEWNNNEKIATMSEIKAESEKIKNVSVDKILKSVVEVVKAYNKTTEKRVSDRRIVQSLRAIAASALMENRTEANNSDLVVLKYTIPETPEDVDSIVTILGDFAVSSEKLREEIKSVIEQVSDLMNRLDEVESISEFNTILVDIKNVSKIAVDIASRVNADEIPEINELLKLKDELSRKMTEVMLNL